MDVRPFVLVGDSALDALRGRAAEALAGWRAAWGVELRGLEIAGVRGHEGDESGAAVWHSWRPSGAAVAWVAMEPGFDRGLRRAFFPDETGEAGELSTSLAAEVAGTARGDLAATLIAAMRGKQTVARARLDPEEPPAWLLANGSGAVALDLTLEGASMRILVASAELPRPAPEAREPGRPLVHTADALQHAPVTVAVQIGTVELELGAVQALAPGDVIRLGTKIGEPLALTASDGTALCRGHLGKHDGVRAVDLVP
jgi:flagellar motor switch/type III secretory pathway protein FliN